jgi:branched-chain amino acid transport system substrate-binding protein
MLHARTAASLTAIASLTVVASLAGIGAGLSAANAQEVLKLGLIQSLTGAFNTTGKAAVNGALLYLKQHGDTVAGRKIAIVTKDDATAPDAAKRLAQDLIVNEKIAVMGVGITPSALTVAPLATEGKIPTVVLVSGASVTVERSPYMVRTSFTLGQSSATIADWAVKNGAKKIVTIVNDWAPGLEAEAAFKERAVKGGAEIVESMRVPLANPDFAPFLQRARDDKPDTLFVYFPGFQAGLRQAVRRARHGQVGDPHHRPRRPHRRRRAARHDGCDARHRHRAPLLGDPRFRAQQVLCRRFREGLWQAPELRLGRRL